MANSNKNQGPLLHQVMDIVGPGDSPAQRMQQIQAATMMQRTADPEASNPVVSHAFQTYNKCFAEALR